MNYIVLDMEWNQAWPGSAAARLALPIHGEIIQLEQKEAAPGTGNTGGSN